MKKLFLFLPLFYARLYAQPLNDTLGELKQQKENIISAATIVQIENLGKQINTRMPELRPTISADGNILFFIRESDPQNTKYGFVQNSQDIWYSIKDDNGKWTEAEHLPYPLNTYFYNAVFWVSPDNNRILIRNAYIKGDYVGNGVSMSSLNEKGYWSKPEMLRIKNYAKYDRGQQNGASMAQDGKTLLLYMTEQKGGENNDIYVCFLQKDSTWSEPKSLGKKINLKDNDEMTPYLASDGVTLYFSSDRPGGLGNNDIWMTKRLDSSWQKWSDPVNLGAPINTPEWDAFFTLDAGGEYAYLTSGHESVW